MARFYANENFPRPVVEALRKLGHDVLTSSEADQANRAIPDPEVLVFATQETRAVLTINRKDFIRLHNQSPQHAGIVVCTQDVDFAGQAGRIDSAIKTFESLNGALIRVYKDAKKGRAR